jgi:hypothetical protein
MVRRVRLRDIVEALQMQFDESSSYLNLDTGAVETVSNDLLSQAEESREEAHPDLPKWELEAWEIAKQIVSSDRFIALPTKFDVHEWAIMEEFSWSVPSDSVRDELLDAIHGTGAFRHFKSAIRRHELESAWYSFRDEALQEIARDWCDENGIAYE